MLKKNEEITLNIDSCTSLGSGGGTYGQTSERFGGGGGAGVKIDPVAFLGGAVQVLRKYPQLSPLPFHLEGANRLAIFLEQALGCPLFLRRRCLSAV